MSDKNIYEEQNTENETQKIHLEVFVKSFFRFWWVCLICAVLLGAFAFYRSYVQFRPVYKSSVTFTVQTQWSGSSSEGGVDAYSFSYNRAAASQLSSSFPSIIKSNILQDIVCNDLRLSYFPCSLSASSVSGTNLFTITASGSNPELTYSVLLSVIKNYPVVAEYVIGNTQLIILNEPVLPTEPANRFDYRSQILRYAFFGVLIGLAWIVFYALQRNTVCSRQDIRQKLNQHCLGALPVVVFKKHKKEINRSISIMNPLVGSSYLESFRAFRNEVVNKLGGKKVILVTGTAPGEGKTSVSANLSISLAKMGHSVLLIDGDLRNPSVYSFFGIPDNGEQRSRTFRNVNVPVGDTGSLNVLRFTANENRIWDLLRPQALGEIFAKLREKYDYIIIDTSPIGITSEPTAFAQQADTAILVIRQDTIRTSSITAAIDTLLSSGVDLLGCVLNGTSHGYNSYGSKYGYHYGSYGSYGYRYGYGYGYGYGSRYGYGERTDKTDPKA